MVKSVVMNIMSDEAPKTELTLRELERMLDQAAEDTSIEGILVLGGDGRNIRENYSTGMLEEICRPFQRFRKQTNGTKRIASYFTCIPGAKAYYLAVLTADAGCAFVSPNAAVHSMGCRADFFHFSDSLQKFLGAKVHAIRPFSNVYKTLREEYYRPSPSRHERKQIQEIWGNEFEEMANSIWEARFASSTDSPKINREWLRDVLAGDESVAESDVRLLTDMPDESDPQLHAGYKASLLGYRGALEWRKGLSDVVEKLVGTLLLPNKPSTQLDSNATILVYPIDERITSNTVIKFAPFVGSVNDRYNRGELIKEIILRINSEGGDSHAADLISQKLIPHLKVPVTVTFGETACSAAYQIAATSGKAGSEDTKRSTIFANAMTTTGSIGVVTLRYDASGTMEKLGVSYHAIASGRIPGDDGTGNPFKPMSLWEWFSLQRKVGKCYSDFVNMVASGRGMSPAQIQEIAKGRVWTGQQAVENGLVDHIGTFSDAVAHVVKKHEKHEDYRIEFVEPTNEVHHGNTNDTHKTIAAQQPSSFVKEISMKNVDAKEEFVVALIKSILCEMKSEHSFKEWLQIALLQLAGVMMKERVHSQSKTPRDKL